MAILRIESENPNLSYVLQKNPEQPLFPKSLKQGALFGYFPKQDGIIDQQKFVIYFKDASDEITYKRHPDEHFEYLSSSKYNNARFINDAIQEILHTSREKPVSEDTPFIHRMIINLVETEFKTIDIFSRHFPELRIISEEVSKNNFRVTFVTNEPMMFQRFILIINLFGIFASLNSDDYIYQTDDFVAKYVRIASAIDAPYFIRYLLKIRLMRDSVSRFEKFKRELETSAHYQIKMEYGDTHVMRINWIKGIIGEPVRPIVDIGAGRDYKYMKEFVKLLRPGQMYYAIERDFDARERIKAGLRNRGWENQVELFESLDEFIEYHKVFSDMGPVDLICTEVLEHNTYPEAQKIVADVVNNIKFNKFIITVPNEGFNKYYGISGFRHNDHKWEATGDDVLRLPPMSDEFIYSISPVGDTVDSIPVSYGLVLTNK